MERTSATRALAPGLPPLSFDGEIDGGGLPHRPDTRSSWEPLRGRDVL